jgi:hypothetical protein
LNSSGLTQVTEWKGLKKFQRLEKSWLSSEKEFKTLLASFASNRSLHHPDTSLHGVKILKNSASYEIWGSLETEFTTALTFENFISDEEEASSFFMTAASSHSPPPAFPAPLPPVPATQSAGKQGEDETSDASENQEEMAPFKLVKPQLSIVAPTMSLDSSSDDEEEAEEQVVDASLVRIHRFGSTHSQSSSHSHAAVDFHTAGEDTDGGGAAGGGAATCSASEGLGQQATDTSDCDLEKSVHEPQVLPEAGARQGLAGEEKGIDPLDALPTLEGDAYDTTLHQDAYDTTLHQDSYDTYQTSRLEQRVPQLGSHDTSECGSQREARAQLDPDAIPITRDDASITKEDTPLAGDDTPMSKDEFVQTNTTDPQDGGIEESTTVAGKEKEAGDREAPKLSESAVYREEWRQVIGDQVSLTTEQLEELSKSPPRHHSPRAKPALEPALESPTRGKQESSTAESKSQALHTVCSAGDVAQGGNAQDEQRAACHPQDQRPQGEYSDHSALQQVAQPGEREESGRTSAVETVQRVAVLDNVVEVP